MDATIFFITSVISKSCVPKKRILAVSLIESLLYCVFAAMGLIFSASGIVFALSANLAALYIIFMPKSLKRFFELALIMVLTAFTVCGFVIWLLYFSGIPQAVGYYFGKGYGRYTALMLVLSSAVSYLFIRLSGKWIDKSYSQREKYCQVRFFYNGLCAEVTALIDSGNFLKGAEGRPLVVAETGAVVTLFKDNLSAVTDSGYDGENSERFSYINYSSLGNKCSSMKTFRPDKTEFIFSRDKSIYSEADIAFYNGILSSEGGYSAIISGDDYSKLVNSSQIKK